jgi:hypothetical protein
VTDDYKKPGERAASMLEEIEDARWKLTPGFDVETGLGLSATSRIAHAFDIGDADRVTDNPWCSFAVFDGKGEFSSAQDATNHAEGVLSSTIAYCRRTPGTFKVPVAVGLTADFRSKWGTFEEGEGDQKKTFEGNQSIVGAGLTVLMPSPPSWLKGLEFTTAYYRVIDSEGDLPVAEDLDIDHLQARLKSKVAPFDNLLLKEVAFIIDGRASWPLEGANKDDVEYYTSLALEIGSGKTAGTVRWERGKEVGFEYDRKLVLGVILRLLGAGGS